MNAHRTVLGILYIAYGAVGILVAGIVFLAVAGAGWISGDEEAIWWTSGVATFAGCFLFMLNLPAVIGGYYFLRGEGWARTLLLFLGVLSLLNVPLGTALGIYTIWVLTRPPEA